MNKCFLIFLLFFSIQGFAQSNSVKIRCHAFQNDISGHLEMQTDMAEWETASACITNGNAGSFSYQNLYLPNISLTVGTRKYELIIAEKFETNNIALPNPSCSWSTFTTIVGSRFSLFKGQGRSIKLIDKQSGYADLEISYLWIDKGVVTGLELTDLNDTCRVMIDK